ncbi:MAG TPA: universal stress protein [Methanocella sp.]|uniref:universal stress protein n=1 Tax=Methanocella sp. TaxID=2052833 RepID=UPI002D0D09D4|nr:universal stress protein [Methanocella sp.]HTY91702.1 universal stress protein [Methanocella sp.]
MKILLATDGMPHTDKAVEYAIEYASRYKASLFVVYVLSPGSDQKAAYGEGKEAVQGVKLKVLTKGVGVTTMLEQGEPAETIVRTADKIGADAVIMGASGKCEGSKRPLGSVSARVAQDACCSVIIVR